MSGVLQIGDPKLRRISEAVSDFHDPIFKEDCQKLHRELESFREQYGFGRAIAAPQIDIPRRLIAANLGEGPITLVNPEITWRSQETMTLWDDCMSFPMLLVRVKRHASISIRFKNEAGELQTWDRLPKDLSELFQHEIDHLEGVLAMDLALNKEAIVSRSVFQTNPSFFREQVSYWPVS